MSHHSLHNSKLCQIYLVGTIKWGDIEQRGDIEPKSYPFHGETHWIVSITVMSQDVCFRLLAKGFCSLNPKFMKCSYNLWPSFFFFAYATIFKWKNLMFRDKALIESYLLSTCPRDMQKHLFDLYICLICASVHLCIWFIVTILAREIRISFF